MAKLAIASAAFSALSSSLLPKHMMASRTTTIRCSSGTRIYPQTLPSDDNELAKISESILKVVEHIANDAKRMAVNAVTDVIFKPSSEVNHYFEGNFAPVPEIPGRTPCRVIEGALPNDFPSGVYIRNGPNPQFYPHHLNSPFGNANEHWFEGEGMLHATYFGPDGSVQYHNKFIEIEAYKAQKEWKRCLWVHTLEADPIPTNIAFLLNQLQFGKEKANKVTCNTSVFEHANRVFVISEGDLPREINPATLEVIKPWNWDGKWNRPFTSHPKVLKHTGEMVVFGFSATKPYVLAGVISNDGERLIHTVDIGLDRCVFIHDVGATDQYILFLDSPFTVNLDRVAKGQQLLDFEHDGRARIAVVPRYGNAKAVKWFDVENNFTYHLINCYEDGDEVVVHGCQAKIPIFAPKYGMNKKEWFTRAITPPKENEQPLYPQVDGKMISHAHEWRLNMKTGNVVERILTEKSFSMDMPTINNQYIGHKNLFAYANVVDLEASRIAGLPKYGKLVKLHLNEKEGDCVKFEFYDPGPNTYISEPIFVPRNNSIVEDDGWIVTYVHYETYNLSEVHVLAANDFNGKPITRIQLPQRVPYGLHGPYVPGVF